MKMILVFLIMILSPIAYGQTFTTTQTSINLAVDQSVNSGGATYSITFTNTGSTTASMTSAVQLTQGSTNPFSILSNRCISILAGRTCVVSVQFNQNVAGDYPTPVQYAAQINSNSGTPVSLAMSVLATQPVYSFQVQTAYIEAIFTTPAVSGNALILTYTLLNTGNRTASITPTISSGTNPSTSINSQTCQSVNVGKTCVVKYSTQQIVGQDVLKTITFTDSQGNTGTAQLLINGFKPYKLTTVGIDHNLYQSTNNGTSFSTLTFGYSPTGYSIYDVSGSKITANLFTSGSNSVQISQDSGTSFSTVTIPGGSNKSISLSGSSILAVTYNQKFHLPGYYTSDYGSVQLSQDAGASFQSVTLPTNWTKALYGELSGSKLMLVDSSPMKVVVSTDNGSTFSSITLPSNVQYVEQVLINGNDMVLYGTKDALNQSAGSYLSNDGGVTFINLPLPTTDLTTISQVGLSGGYVFFKVYDPTALKTSLKLSRDRGVSYQTVSNPASLSDTAGYVLELN